MIDLNILHTLLNTASLKQDAAISFFSVLDSTNEYLYQKTLTDKHYPQVVIAAHQTAGKGRQGRVWLDQPNTSLLFSCFYCFSNITAIQFLPLIVGVAIAEVLSTYNPNLGLKWPNDLFVNEKKIGGILVETRLTTQSEVIIGVGINVYSPSTLELSQLSTALVNHTGLPIDLNQLLAALLDNLFLKLKAFETRSLDWQTAFKQFDILYNSSVRVQKSNEDYIGIARGIDAEGALLIETLDGMKREIQATVRKI